VVFGWLRKSKRTGTAARLVLPTLEAGLRIYAVGDIHGRLDLLDRLHQMILAHLAASPEAQSVIVYVGDYVDRGPASATVIDRLVEPGPVLPPAICLRGNHEEILLQFLTDPSVANAWKPLGGFETLQSYGVPAKLFIIDRDYEAARQVLAERIPPRHMAFLQRLAASHRIGPYFFAHAGIRPGVPLEQQSERDLVWIRDEFLSSVRDHGAVIVHGHTPSEAPEIRANRINIDTGAYATGRLTCAVLEGSGVSWLAT
jgi:serine/threonine protein phosphatase 1